MNSKKKIREFVLLVKSTPRKMVSFSEKLKTLCNIYPSSLCFNSQPIDHDIV